jgi:dienelactone hydrolase
MSIPFACEHCGKRYNVAEHLAGKKVKCRQCGQGTTIPQGESAEPAIDIYGLDDPDLASDTSDREEVATEPAPRVVVKAPAGSKPKTNASGGGTGSGFSVANVRGLLGGAFVILVIGFRIYRVANRVVGPEPRNPVAPAAMAPALTPEPELPSLSADAPEPGPGVEIKRGIMLHEVRVDTVRPGQGIKLWLYLPSGEHAEKSLPCVLIAPAGSILVTGMGLGDGDRPEHLPYVSAGFAVLSYELEGELRKDPSQATLGDVKQAAQAFLAAKAGLSDAHVALEWLLAKVPEVDPDRLYTAGHSSAGTMALLLAENEPRIKACVAFAPRADVATNFDADQTRQLRSLIPGFDRFLTTYNPKPNDDRLNCPVFLFHARDDSVVPVSLTEEFATELEQKRKSVTLEIVPDGDHHTSMIRKGIPRAIQWLREKATDTP